MGWVSGKIWCTVPTTIWMASTVSSVAHHSAFGAREYRGLSGSSTALNSTELPGWPIESDPIDVGSASMRRIRSSSLNSSSAAARSLRSALGSAAGRGIGIGAAAAGAASTTATGAAGSSAAGLGKTTDGAAVSNSGSTSAGAATTGTGRTMTGTGTADGPYIGAALSSDSHSPAKTSTGVSIRWPG